MHETLLKHALAMADTGLPIFPLNGKQPATRHGFKDATTDHEQVKHWWATTHPGANIGLPVMPGVTVLDYDPRSGPDALDQLQQRYGPLPATTTCVSGRGDGGRHLYYKTPEGAYTDKNLPPGIDIRVGGKHYCVAAPSIHPDTGGHYYWTGPEYIADAPRWLIDLLRPVIRQPVAPDPDQIGDGAGLIRFVTELQPGQRNHGYFWSVCEAIESGSWGVIQEDLKNAARHIGLTEHEVEATAASAQRRMTD